MANSLQDIFQAIAAVRRESDLRDAIVREIGAYFEAHCWGICLVDEASQSAEVKMHGEASTSSVAQRFSKEGRATDPVLRYVRENHAPAHEALVLPPDNWKQGEPYQKCYAYYGDEHVMMGPIIGNGELMGGVYFSRRGEQSAFSAKDLADLSAICTHLSVRLAVLRSQSSQFNTALANRLTERELQIAELVAQGLTNAEISAQLWITQNSVKQALKRMFRKLEVSARAELVARLRDVSHLAS